MDEPNIAQIKAIAAVLGPRGRDGNLQEGQKIRVPVSLVGGTQRLGQFQSPAPTAMAAP